MAKAKVKKKPTFKQWLDDEGISLEDFVRKVPGVKINTVKNWIYSAQQPRDAHADLIRKHYPDCPLVS